MPLTNYTVYSNSTQFSTSFTIQLGVLEDTDGDGEPNELPADYLGDLVEDSDDDGDGASDADEAACLSIRNLPTPRPKTLMAIPSAMHWMRTLTVTDCSTRPKTTGQLHLC